MVAAIKEHNMAGGVGGEGNSPYGRNGSNGQTQFVNYFVSYAPGPPVNGGPGGQNQVVVVDGPDIYGPYGSGADGASSPATTGVQGNPGGVVIAWGGGNSYNVKYQIPTSITATSSGSGSGGGGPRGQPGYQYTVSGGDSTYIATYAPVSRYWVADSTGDSSFAWSRALAFISPNSNITAAELASWGFDPSDVPVAYTISLDEFSADVDSSWSIGWALVEHGASSLAQSHTFNTVGLLADSIADRHFRDSASNPFSVNDNGGNSYYGFGPWLIPTPNVNQLLYMWCADGSGTDTRTITMTYT